MEWNLLCFARSFPSVLFLGPGVRLDCSYVLCSYVRSRLWWPVLRAIVVASIICWCCAFYLLCSIGRAFPWFGFLGGLGFGVPDFYAWSCSGVFVGCVGVRFYVFCGCAYMQMSSVFASLSLVSSVGFLCR